MHDGTNGKRDIYRRDILRDYALAASELEAQFGRFEESGVISFAILRGILGEAHSKGLLWKLKDTARHLSHTNAELPETAQDVPGESGRIFGQAGIDSPRSPARESECRTGGAAERYPGTAAACTKYLGWALGFLFHECRAVLEASCQMQKYLPVAQDFAPLPADSGQDANGLCPARPGGSAGARPPMVALDEVRRELSGLAAETRDGLNRGIGRIRRLLDAVNLLMCAYLDGETHNRPLARLFHDREDLLRSVFKNRYAELRARAFGPEPERLLLEAAWSLFESGHPIRAEHAAQKALALNPASAEAAGLLDKTGGVRQ